MKNCGHLDSERKAKFFFFNRKDEDWMHFGKIFARLVKVSF